MFTVFDSAAGLFLEPFFAPTEAFAVRLFGYLVNKPGHQFAAHAEDFTLYVVGEFDQASGEVGRHNPKPLGNGLTLRTEDVEDGQG